ncbi:MAG: OsmC family protein [Acinetobacter sp.]
MAIHHYSLKVQWLGNTGTGTSEYRAYKRDFEVQHPNKPSIVGSADPAYRGDANRWNPEDLLVASASACHKLWYLHLCAVNQIQVLSYEDDAIGSMDDAHPSKRGHITQIILRPNIVLRQGNDLQLAQKLHEDAHHECMIANSVNFPILCEPTFHFDES